MALPIHNKGNSIKHLQSFDSALVDLNLINPNNEAVDRLERDPQLRRAIMQKLKEIGQTEFINLVTRVDQALVSIALYAGDGVVTKVTPCNYMSSEAYPFVLPPFTAHTVECGDELHRRVMIENYPYLSTKGIGQEDVEAMERTLATVGLRFKINEHRPGGVADARPDNIARLKDGTLAVIDGDAVEPIDFAKGWKSVSM